MASIRPPKRAILFCGMLYQDPDLATLAKRRLGQHLGEIASETDVHPFDHTDYYETETGPNIQRQFIFFTEPVSIERLAEIKRLTNDIEHGICDDVARPHDLRPVNLDPGYLTLSKIVLATTKDASHRIYLEQGIHAEVTLRFHSGQWSPLPWTYPDYAADTFHPDFIRARETLKSWLSEGL